MHRELQVALHPPKVGRSFIEAGAQTALRGAAKSVEQSDTTVTRRHALNRTFVSLGGAALFSITPLTGQAAGFTGYTQSVAGTNGNPALSTPRNNITGAGAFVTGPLVGPNGNTSSSNVNVVLAGPTVNLGGPLPSLSLMGTGEDPAGSTGTYGFAIAGLSYTFTVNGPASSGLVVPVRIKGFTDGSVVQTGDPSQFFSFAGTSIEIQAVGLAASFADLGTTGNLPTVSGIAPDGARIGWGHSAASPVNYVDYASSFLYGVNLLQGESGSISINGYLQGGVAGLVKPTGIPASGTAQAYIDPFIYIDPAFMSLHPGYQIVVESGIGNGTVSSVPEPSTSVLLGVGLIGLVALRGRDLSGDSA